jgi:hypothetical protein
MKKHPQWTFEQCLQHVDVGRFRALTLAKSDILSTNTAWQEARYFSAEDRQVFCHYLRTGLRSVRSISVVADVETLSDVALALAMHPNIRHFAFILRESTVTVDRLCVLAQSLSELLRRTVSLRRLDLLDVDFGNEALPQLFAALASNATIKFLNITSERGTPMHKNKKKLKTRIHSSVLRDSTAQTFVGSLLDKTTCQAISDSLAQNSTLRSFYFWSQRLNKAGSQVMFDFLKTNNTLTTLHMQGNSESIPKKKKKERGKLHFVPALLILTIIIVRQKILVFLVA